MIGRNEKCPCGSGKRYKKCCMYKDAKSLDAFFNEVLPKLEYIDSRLYIDYYRDTLKEILKAFSTIRVYYNENMEPVKYNMPVHDYIPKIRPIFKKFINLILQDDLPKDLKSICYCHIAIIIMNIYINGLTSLDKASHNLKIRRDLFYNRSIDNFISMEKECINRSIALCPNNTFALSILIDYYRATKDNMGALKTILSYDNVKESFDSILNKYDVGLNNFKGDDILRFFILDLNDGYYDKSLNNEEVTNLLHEIIYKFKDNHEVVEAIEMKLVQSNIKIENNINKVLSNKDSNYEEYVDTIVKDKGKITPEDLANMAFFAKNDKLGPNYVTGQNLMFEKKYDEVIKNIKHYADHYPNNSNLSNLAFSLMKEERYDESIEYCRKAMLITEDEVEYYIMAQCLFFQEKYKEAIKWYQMAIAFMDSGGVVKTLTENNYTMLSIQLQDNEMLDESYENIITCFMNLEQYHKANVYCSMAKKRNKYNDKVKKLETIIKTHKLSMQETEKTTEELNNELDTIRNKYSNIINKVKYWGEELLKIKTLELESIDFSDEIALDQYFNKISSITEKMVLSVDNQNSYEETKNEIFSKYDALEMNSKEFLTTAEYLYKNYIDQNIDFSPIILEYSKVLENELNKIFDKNTYFKGYRKTKEGTYTLGTCLLVFKEKGKELDIDEGIIKLLDEFVTKRNGSAHTSLADKLKMDRIREIFYSSDLINQLMEIKNLYCLGI